MTVGERVGEKSRVRKAGRGISWCVRKHLGGCRQLANCLCVKAESWICRALAIVKV